MPLQPGDVKVDNVTRIARLERNGDRTNFYNVTFTVRGIITDAIEIPEKEYSADEAMKRVSALAAEHVRVLEMT